jgi:RNA polymerase sigma-70 factor, ECF subfamily
VSVAHSVAQEAGNLLDRLKSSDPAVFIEAFAEVVVFEHKRAFRLAIATLGSREQAEDVAQEVFVRLQKVIPKLKGDVRLAPYICAITRNVCIDMLRRRRNIEDERVLAHVVSSDRAPDDIAEQHQRARLVRDAIEQLPISFREVVALCCIGELSYQETADMLHIPTGTVKSRVSRGLKLLKGILDRKEATAYANVVGLERPEQTLPIPAHSSYEGTRSLLNAMSSGIDREEVKARIRAAGGPVYTTDPSYPGKIVEVGPDGTRVPGRLEGRRFIAEPPSRKSALRRVPVAKPPGRRSNVSPVIHTARRLLRLVND